MARRKLGIGGALLCVLSLAVIANPVPPALAAVDPAAGWPQFRGAPDHTASTAPSLITSANVASLAPAWHFQAGTSPSSPAVVDGVAYVGSSSLGAVGSSLYAFAADGQGCTPAADCPPLWRGQTGAGVVSSPAVVGGVVYVGSTDHSLYAFSASACGAATCAPLWTAATLGPIQSSPAVVGGVVYVGSDDDGLYAFDAQGVVNCGGTPKTCAPLWRGTTPSDVISSPAVAGGVVYAVSTTGLLSAFDAAGVTNCAGSPKVCGPIWTAALGAPNDASPAVVGGVVYVAGGATLLAFDAGGVTNCSGSPKTCTPLWSAPTGGVIFSSPAVAGGVVYAGSFDKKLYAFDAGGVTGCSGLPKTCTPLWTGTTLADDLIISSPAVANGLVFIGSGSSDHRVYAFDAAGTTGCSGTPKTCQPMWTGDTPAGARSSPAVAGGSLYVASDASVLSVFSLPPADRFHPLPPERILDTRTGLGAVAAQKLGPDAATTLAVTGRGGVPAAGVSAVVLNVTVTEPTADSYMTVWPAGEAKPLASNLNFRPGQNVPNLVTVKVGAGGQVAIYNLAGATHVVADVSGWYGPDGAGYTTLTPARILDTRTGNGAPAAKLGADATLALQVAGRGGVPAAGATAVVLNVTVTEPTADSFLTVWPAGQARPLVSNLDFMPGQTVPNLVVVKVGAGGEVDLYNNVGAAHVIADVAGWFGVVGGAGSGFTAVAPQRILDTRSGNGAPVAKLGANATLALQVTGRAGVPPAGVSAVVLNVTVTEPTAESFLTVWPAGEARPLASNLNDVANKTVANLVVVKVGAGGQINLYNLVGATHVIADVAGWFGA
jgi:outer membrane protein assembly factor BamB